MIEKEERNTLDRRFCVAPMMESARFLGKLYKFKRLVNAPTRSVVPIVVPGRSEWVDFHFHRTAVVWTRNTHIAKARKAYKLHQFISKQAELAERASSE